MRTTPSEWTVEILRTRLGAGCRVRRRAIIGADGGRATAPIGQFRVTVDEVSELLEPLSADLTDLTDLTEVAG